MLWGFRVIVLEKLREQLLSELHSSHLGVYKMKSIARSSEELHVVAGDGFQH